MKKLRIAFYKSEAGEWDDKFIDWGTGKKGFSHCEVMVNDNTMIGAHYIQGGVREFNYNSVINSDKWVVLELDVPAKYAVEYAKACIGVGYDTKGVLLHFAKITFYEDPDKVWCSEFCALCINKAIDPLGDKETIKNPCIMPNTLYDIMIGSGAHIIKQTKSKKSRSKIQYSPEVDRFGRI